jgi:hypothetical protein
MVVFFIWLRIATTVDHPAATMVALKSLPSAFTAPMATYPAATMVALKSLPLMPVSARPSGFWIPAVPGSVVGRR